MSEPKSIEQVIKEEGKYVCTTSGFSMYPLLSDRRDTVIITPVCGRLKKYDVPLYRRGSSYVLHRIVKVLPDSYVTCGDNCESFEYGIKDSDIIGVMSAFYRKDKYYTVNDEKYRIYSKYIVNSFKARIGIKKLRRLAKRAAGKIKRTIIKSSGEK